MKVLVTGFDPFGGESINPAYEAVKMLPDEIAGAQIIKREIPTSFTRGTAEVVRQIELCQPDLVLNVGQAGGAAGLRVERVAINLADARIPDNDGAQPVDEPLVQDGAPAYFAKLPVKAMVRGVQAKGYPCQLSYTAGTYVCNAVMYTVLHCGVPFSRLADDYKSLKLVLLTHIHGDHFNPATLRKLARERPTLRFACCVWLCAALVDAGVKASQIDVISTELWYIYNGLCRIKAQETKHDVQNCCWHIELPNTPVERLFYATDTNNLNGITAKGYDLYLVEANYTEADIQDRIAEKKINGEYVYEKRVMREHLSKEKADDWLCANMAAYSEYIYMHGHQEKDN